MKHIDDLNSGRPKTQRMMFPRVHYLSTTGFHEKQINKCCKIVSKDIKKMHLLVK